MELKHCNIKIYVLKFGEIKLSENQIFENGGDVLRDVDMNLFLIIYKDRRILIDSGCRQESMKAYLSRNFAKIDSLLGKLSLSCDDITDLILTHTHSDHCEQYENYQNAIVHVQKDELEKLFYINPKTKFNVFDKEYEIDENIKIKNTGGHSVGHSIVEVDLGSKILAFCGDACYSLDCLRRQKVTGLYKDREKAQAFIKKYCDEKYQVYLAHDTIIKEPNGIKEIEVLY